MEFITSDLHFGHESIHGPKGFCKETRGHFKTTTEMNEHLIQAHNSVVSESDTTYHLGDLSWNVSREDVLKMLNLMNGQIHLVKGNHDSRRVLNFLLKNNYVLRNGNLKFVIHDVGLIIKRNKGIYHLTHYPLQLGGRRELRSLCGHIHDEQAEYPYALNVGIDSPELPSGHPFGVPLTLDKACELSERKYQEYLLDKEKQNS